MIAEVVRSTDLGWSPTSGPTALRGGRDRLLLRLGDTLAHQRRPPAPAGRFVEYREAPALAGAGYFT